MRSLLLGLTVLMALAVPAAAQPHGGFGGHAGRFGGGFGRGWFAHRGVGFRPHPGFGGRFRQRFSSASPNGHLTLDQARAGHMPMIARHFDEIDSQHKGYVTLDDIRAYQRKVQARRRAAQGDYGAPDTPNPYLPPR